MLIKANNTKNWKIPLYKIYTDNNVVKAVSYVRRRGMDWAIGPEIEEFEKGKWRIKKFGDKMPMVYALKAKKSS